MSTPLRFPCLSVTQPLGTFYLAVIKAGDLLRRVEILRRDLDSESQGYVQRELSGKRAKEIAAYLGDTDATFPTSIIVAANPFYVHVVPTRCGTEIVFGKARSRDGSDLAEDSSSTIHSGSFEALSDHEKVGSVIDGQHRLAGLELAGARDDDSPYFCFELPVVFMVDLEPENQAYVFSTINSKQTRVSSSLIIDLFGVATSRSPKKTCHDVAAALNADQNGPFFQTLKMLGKKNLPTESLTQGAFAKYLLTMISRRPDDDERAIKSGKSLALDETCPLRQFFIDGHDEMIVKVLSNYFGAIRDAYPSAWSDAETYALRRTVGFSALMGAFKVVWEREVRPTGKATMETFRNIVARFVIAVPEEALKNINSNEKGASDLARRFTRDWQLATLGSGLR